MTYGRPKYLCITYRPFFHFPSPIVPILLCLKSHGCRSSLLTANQIWFLLNDLSNPKSTFPFTAKKARVLATTIAALDERPEPAGTDPVTRRFAETGKSFPTEKWWFKTPWRRYELWRGFLAEEILTHVHNTQPSHNSPIATPWCWYLIATSLHGPWPRLPDIALPERIFAEHISNVDSPPRRFQEHANA